MCLQLFQTGLGWLVVLNKAPALHKAFADFDPARVAAFDEQDIERLLNDASIIRHRGKITAVINNAKVVNAMEKQKPGAFSDFVWEHAPTAKDEILLASGKHLSSHMRSDYKTKAEDRPTSDGVHPTQSVAIFTKACKQKGFKHVGETTLLSFWQAVGVMNHHSRGCFAFHEIEASKALPGGANTAKPSLSTASRARTSQVAASSTSNGKRGAKAGETPRNKAKREKKK